MEIGPPVLEKKKFEGFLPYIGRGGHLGHVIHMPRTKFRSPYPRRLHIKFGFDQVVFEKMLEHFERRATMADAGPWVYYKLTYEPLAQVS